MNKYFLSSSRLSSINFANSPDLDFEVNTLACNNISIISRRKFIFCCNKKYFFQTMESTNNSKSCWITPRQNSFSKWPKSYRLVGFAGRRSTEMKGFVKLILRNFWNSLNFEARYLLTESFPKKSGSTST